MYNETLKAENRIITGNDLAEIFQLMGDTLKRYQKISEMEEQQNRMLEYSYQHYTFKDEGSKMKVTVDFYDNTSITFDKYEPFIGIFYSRLQEIKNMHVHYNLSYTVMTPEPNRSRNYFNQSITMDINENKIDIQVNLSSDDNKLESIYTCLKNKILNAPLKYDMIIKDRGKITNIVAFAIGLIPGLIICILLLFIPTINNIFFKGIIVFPIASVILAFIIGSIIASIKLDKYYTNIMPEKKYDGYKDGHASYSDDVNKYINSSEILIGKKVDNLTNRERIKREYEKYRKYLPKELIALGIISVIVIVIGLFT